MLWYRGTVGPIARVYGPGGASGRPRRRVATRVSILSGIEKKDDLDVLHTHLKRNATCDTFTQFYTQCERNATLRLPVRPPPAQAHREDSAERP